MLPTNTDVDTASSRSDVVVAAAVSNWRSWALGIVALALALYVRTLASKLSGTGDFFTYLFLAFGAIFVLYGLRNVRMRLKQYAIAERVRESQESTARTS